MTPEQLAAWARQHGGAAGDPEGPDQHGITVYRAADGAFINVRPDGSLAMQGVDAGGGTAAAAAPTSDMVTVRNRVSGEMQTIPRSQWDRQGWLTRQAWAEVPPAPAPAATAAPPDATSSSLAPASPPSTPAGVAAPAPGSQQDVLAQLAAIAPGGDASQLENIETQEEREVTDTSSLNPVKVKRMVPVRVWYDPSTGRALKFDVNSDGTFTRTFSGIDKTLIKTATAAGAKPTIPTGGSSETQGTPDPLKPGGWDNSRPRQVIKDKNGTVIWSEELTGADLTAWRAAQQANQPQTGEIRKSVEGRPDWTAITRTNVQGGNKTETTVYVGPDGREVPTPPGQTASERVPDKTHPGYVVVKTVNPQTNATETHYEREGAPGVVVPTPPDIKPGTILQGRGKNGEDVQARVDPATGDVTYEPIPGAPRVGGPLPAGTPSYTPDYSQDDLGLSDYQRALVDYQRLNPDNLSMQQGKDLIEQAGALATYAQTHGTTLRTQAREGRAQDITQRGQDLTEVGSRRSAANGLYSAAFDQFNKAQVMGGDAGLAADAFLAALHLGRQNAADWGGLRDIPREPPDAYSRALGPGGQPPGGAPQQAGSRSVQVHPDGRVEVSVPHGAGPDQAGAAPQAGPPTPLPPPASYDPGFSVAPGRGEDPGFSVAPGPNRDPGFYVEPGANRDPGFYRDPGVSRGAGPTDDPGFYRDPGVSRGAGPTDDPGFYRGAGPTDDPGFYRDPGVARGTPEAQRPRTSLAIDAYQRALAATAGASGGAPDPRSRAGTGFAPSTPPGVAGPSFAPDRASLRQQFPDLSDADLEQVIGEHHAERYGSGGYGF